MRFAARRKYVYQLVKSSEEEEEEEYVVVKFFDDEKLPKARLEDGVGSEGQGVGSLFVEMGGLMELASLDATSTTVWKAKNKETHLCGGDLYTASWKFGKGMMMADTAGSKEENREDMWWEVRYDVTGPKKDYVSTTRYTRG
jgi:tRNA A64-2'-O-ribosylphosphate transferase